MASTLFTSLETGECVISILGIGSKENLVSNGSFFVMTKTPAKYFFEIITALTSSTLQVARIFVWSQIMDNNRDTNKTCFVKNLGILSGCI